MTHEFGIIEGATPPPLAKTIFSVALARYLIKTQRHTLLDIKPDKFSDNREKSLYVFLRTPELISDIETFINRKRGEIDGKI